MVVVVGDVIAVDSTFEGVQGVDVELSYEAEDDKVTSCNTSGKFDLYALTTLWCSAFFDMVTPNCLGDAITTS